MARSAHQPVALALALALAGAPSALAQAALPPPAAAAQIAAPADVVVNMRDVEIADVAQQVSRITGRTIILDPSVKGTVNVTSASPLTPYGVWELFISVLRGQGFALVHTGRNWRIVPQANALREPGGAGVVSARVVTRTVRLENVSPEAAARIFRPLVASFGSIEPVTNPNAIVISDYADNVARIAGLARALDGGGSASQFAAIHLQHAAAKDVAAAITTVIGDSAGGAGAGGGGGAGPRAVADSRSNIVLVRGDARALAQARRIALELDRPGGTAPVTRVIRLRNTDAEAITRILAGLMGAGNQANNPVARTLAPSSSGTTNNGNSGGLGDTSALGGTAGGFGGGGSATGLGSLTQNPAVRTVGSISSGNQTSDAAPAGFTTPELAVQPAPELNALVIRGTPAAIAAIEPIITQLDVRRPQVMIEAAIVEIMGDHSEQLGIQLGIGQGANAVNNSAVTSFSNIGVPISTLLSAIGAPIAAGLSEGLTGNFGSNGNFGLLIQALGQSTRANLLSTPSITTLDNEPAEIVVGQNVPFRTGSYSTQGNTTTPFTTIERADVGITLRVVPRVHDGNTVRLEVNQEVSSLVGAVAGAADLITNRRSIQTTVLADDGQTIVLGGLISDDQTRTNSQVPVLGDIPIIGNLFKSRTEQKTRRTLFVFLKPTILRDNVSVAAAAAGRYDQVRRAETALQYQPDLLLQPPTARLPVEIEGIY